MFNIGDIVLHPLHGAGEIVGIERKKVLVKMRDFYIIDLADTMLEKLFVPTDSAVKLGIRYLIDEEKLQMVEKYLKSGYELEINDPWKIQFKKHESMVNSGQIMNVAEAFKFLYYKSLKKKLGEMDKWLLNKSRNILASEMLFLKGSTFDECRKFITDFVKSSVSIQEKDVA